MDNVTHGLWGLGIYGAYAAAVNPVPGHGMGAALCAAAILGSEAPDFDYAIRLAKGPVAYLRQHRGISHSIPAWFVWPLVIAAVVDAFEPGHFGAYYMISFIGVLVHVGLDLLTSYGTQAFWPLSKRRVALDALFIIDPVMLGAGILGWILVAAGAWSTGHAAYALITIVCIYIALRCGCAGVLYDRVARQFPDSWSVSVLPGPLPWWWTFVAQADGELMAGRVGRVGTVVRELHWRWPQRDDSLLQQVLQSTEVGRVFNWFARHLIWTIRDAEETQVVVLADAMYRYGDKLPFTAVVALAKDDADSSALVDQHLGAAPEDLAKLFEHAEKSASGVKPSTRVSS